MEDSMKITFFQKDGTFNEDAIHAGVYIIWVGLTDGKGKDKIAWGVEI